MVVAAAPIVVIFDLIVVGGSARLHFGFTTALAWIVGAPAVMFAISGGVGHLLSRRAASKALGIKVGSGTFPPVDGNSYIAWCREHGLTPFAPSRARSSSD
jgi:hypothetical protein